MHCDAQKRGPLLAFSPSDDRTMQAMGRGGVGRGEQGENGGGAGAAARMREAVAAAMAGGSSRDDLQAASREMVRELRASQQTPEKALLHIKAVLAEAGLEPTYTSADTAEAFGPDAILYRDVIAWSIKAYYDERV
jgi:hypothetical protein